MSERASTKGRERPILFSAPMVRALLAGTKTQTRRIIKPRGRVSLFDGSWSDSYVLDPGNQAWREQEVPIKLDDRLWVREAWRPNWSAEGYREDLGRIGRPSDFDPKRTAIEYLADETHELNGKSRPGIHMPRWASRLTLTVIDVRVQRLQDISEADARAEGAYVGKASGRVADNQMAMNLGLWHFTCRDWYEDLWDRINGAGSWEANPWVAAYTFTVERRNIDEGLGQRADATPNPLSEGRERS